MNRWIPVAILSAVAASGCGSDPGPTRSASSPPAPPPVAAPEPEASRITVQHVLIAFKGAHKAPANVTRTREEAATLTNEILERVRKGEDIAKLAAEYSTDPGGGRYTLVNTGVQKEKSTDIFRKDFIRPFTTVAFKLKIGEAGVAEYDPRTCPYGWHVIKRLE